MYSTFPYSSSLYGGLKGFAPAGASSRFEFNGYSLQSTSVLTINVDEDHAPQRNLRSTTKPRTHGRTILNDTQEQKIVSIEGVLKADTAAELDTLIDTFKKNLIGLQGNLDVTNAAGLQKRYIATLINGESMLSRPGNYVTICPFRLEFACYVPFSKSISYVAQALFGETSLSKSETVDIDGTFEAEAVLIFILNAVDTVTKITFTNDTRGEAIELEETFAASDVLIIDTEQKTVTRNGAAIDYTGVFHVFSLGSNSYTIDVVGTSIDYDVTLKHKTTYL